MDEFRPLVLLISNHSDTVNFIYQACLQGEHIIDICAIESSTSYQHQLEKLAFPQLVLIDFDSTVSSDWSDLLLRIRNWTQGKAPIIVLGDASQTDQIHLTYASGGTAFTQIPDTPAHWNDYIDLLVHYWFGIARIHSVHSAS